MQKNTQKTTSVWGDLNYFNKFNKQNYSLTTIFIIVLFIILNFSFDSKDMFSYTAGVYINILIYILFAVSLNIAVGLMGQLSLGHAGFIAIGGYTAALISKSMVAANLPAFVQLLISSIIGGIVAAVF